MCNNANTCGFCGGDSCNISIIVSSGVGKNANKGVASNCKYFNRFSLKPAETSTKNKPCTNRPVECDLCKTVLWSYNIESHYHVNHFGEDIPSMITQLEIQRIIG